MKWIIEDFHAELGYKDLAYEIIKQGHELKILTLKNFYLEDTMYFPKGEIVLFQGSLNMARVLKFKNYWKPTAWLNEKAYECTSYYPAFDGLIFNDINMFLTYGEFIERTNEIWKQFSEEECIFIRPNSGMKSFSGTIETQDEFEKAKGWRNNFVKLDDIIMVSTPKNILREWRFVTDCKDIISHSQYRHGGRNDVKEYDFTPPEIIEFAKLVIERQYNPDPMWCFDICEDEDGKLWLLEIGSFSCSGLYKCDMEAIVNRASQLAIEAK